MIRNRTTKAKAIQTASMAVLMSCIYFEDIGCMEDTELGNRLEIRHGNARRQSGQLPSCN